MSSSIATYLQQILDAVYGEEVRGAIHDAIEECYTDTSTGATTASEAAAAANEAATAANTAATDVNAALSGFENVPISLFRVPIKLKNANTDPETDDITLALGGINPSTGKHLSSSSYPLTCKTLWMKFTCPVLFVMDTTDYEMTVWTYTSASQSNGHESLTNKAYTNAPVVVPFKPVAQRFKVGFRRVKDDGVTAVTNELINSELLPKLHIYAMIDNTGDLDDSTYGTSFPADSVQVKNVVAQSAQLRSEVDVLNRAEGVTNAIGWKTVQVVDTNNAPAVSALTFIENTLFRFPYVSANQSGTGTKYTVGSDGTLTNAGTFSTNIGHTNTADYCQENNCLLVPRSSHSDAVTDFGLYIFHDVHSDEAGFDIEDSTENKVTFVDFSSVSGTVGDTGINAVWANDNFGKNDYIWLISRVEDNGVKTGKISLVQLGMGSKNLGSGSYTSKPSGIFNGSFKIHKTFDRPWLTATEGCNDACTFAGNIVEVNTITNKIGISLMVHSFAGFFNDVRTERVYIPRNDDSGAGETREYEGVAIKNGYIYIGAVGGGIYVFDMNPYKTDDGFFAYVDDKLDEEFGDYIGQIPDMPSAPATKSGFPKTYSLKCRWIDLTPGAGVPISPHFEMYWEEETYPSVSDNTLTIP